MVFGKSFETDIAEAFEYFKEKQMEATTDPAAQRQIAMLTSEKWVAHLLRKPVYDLIGEKRANEDG